MAILPYTTKKKAKVPQYDTADPVSPAPHFFWVLNNAGYQFSFKTTQGTIKRITLT